MKKLLLLILTMMFVLSCQKSLERRAADEAEDFTRRECPFSVAPNIVLDSMIYDNGCRTMIYHYTLSGQLDNKTIYDENTDKYERHFRQSIITTPEMKPYVDNGFAFRYLYMSASTRDTLLDLNLRF